MSLTPATKGFRDWPVPDLAHDLRLSPFNVHIWLSLQASSPTRESRRPAAASSLTESPFFGGLCDVANHPKNALLGKSHLHGVASRLAPGKLLTRFCTAQRASCSSVLAERSVIGDRTSPVKLHGSKHFSNLFQCEEHSPNPSGLGSGTQRNETEQSASHVDAVVWSAVVTARSREDVGYVAGAALHVRVILACRRGKI